MLAIFSRAFDCPARDFQNRDRDPVEGVHEDGTRAGSGPGYYRCCAERSAPVGKSRAWDERVQACLRAEHDVVHQEVVDDS
eukprot:408969-Pyramimonas_sp.AAC.1